MYIRVYHILANISLLNYVLSRYLLRKNKDLSLCVGVLSLDVELPE